ncbi:unnamed protein product, partial [Polarella glacialis]
DGSSLRLRSPLPMPSAGHARNARLFGIAHNTLAALKEIVPARFQPVVVTEQVQTTLRQTQAAVVSPMTSSLQRSMCASFARLQAHSGQASTSPEGSAELLAVSQACAHISRYYFSLFGAGQLQSYMKELCSVTVRAFLSTAATVKCCGAAERASLVKDMQAVEAALAALDSDFQSRIRYEAAVFKEFRKLLCAQNLESVDFDELTNVIPVHLLLTYLVHQLPGRVPALHAFAGVKDPEQYLEATLLPLWDEQPQALSAFKAKITELCDQQNLDPTESPIVAFIMTQTA